MISLGSHILISEGQWMNVSIISIREEVGMTYAFGEVVQEPVNWVGRTVDIAQTGVRAIVRRIDTECDIHDVTLSPEAAKLGLVPSMHREFVAGMKSASIELVFTKN